jgi:hypothetical protein
LDAIESSVVGEMGDDLHKTIVKIKIISMGQVKEE